MRCWNSLLVRKASRVLLRKADAFTGHLYPLEKTLEAMAARPFELHLELTNLCNANCVFCPYQFQQRETQFMSDEVFQKAVGDYIDIGGGSVGLTPIVGDALIDPKFLNRVRYLRSQPQIDRIWLTTNAILLDKFGVDAVLRSGVNSMNISTAGFEAEMYKRVYRNLSYERMRRNVTALVERNAQLGQPVDITIALRPDRPLKDVLADSDFQPILAHKPQLDFTWSFTSANGRITREMLPETMKLRVVSKRREPCVSTFNGPIVLPDGTLLACSCVAAMDAQTDLAIGNILQSSLRTIWNGDAVHRLRASFSTGALNATCSGCDMYRDLELYRTFEGRRRASLNRARARGRIMKSPAAHRGPFSGG
jgi:radical SAM protein with 4Fe4S-binding SPASM domain